MSGRPWIVMPDAVSARCDRCGGRASFHTAIGQPLAAYIAMLRGFSLAHSHCVKRP